MVDAARTLLVAEIEGKEIARQDFLALQSGRVDKLVQLLHEQKVTTLLCGALCERSVTALTLGGIEIVPFLAGEALSALELWVRGGDLSVLLMPGCRRGKHWRNVCEPAGQTQIPDLRKNIKFRRGKRDQKQKEEAKCQVLNRMDPQDRDR